MDSGDDKITVRQGSSNASFPLIDAQEYPDFLPDTAADGITFPCELLTGAIKKSSVAVAEDDSRPLLTGLLFKKKAEESALQVVGTDGYRLSICEVPFSGTWEKDVVIPAKAVTTLLKGWEGETVVVGFDKKNNQVWFRSNARVGVVRLIQGDFPDFNRIIPSTYSTQIDISRDELLQAVQQMSVFAKQNANIIYMEVGKTIKMSTQSSYVGNGTVELEPTIQGEELTIAFNYRYLREYLSAVASGKITIILNGPLAPVKFIAEGNPDLLHIIMPVKL